jgi:branched-chain amino acid transport system ATP-binding protein
VSSDQTLRKISPIFTILLVEHRARRALDFAEMAIILDRGRIVHDGASAALRCDSNRLAAPIGSARTAGTNRNEKRRRCEIGAAPRQGICL